MDKVEQLQEQVDWLSGWLACLQDRIDQLELRETMYREQQRPAQCMVCGDYHTPSCGRA